MIVVNTFVRPVLLVDLEDARVLVIGGRENVRRLSRQEESGVSAVTVHESANDKHVGSEAPSLPFASREAGNCQSETGPVSA